MADTIASDTPVAPKTSTVASLFGGLSSRASSFLNGESGLISNAFTGGTSAAGTSSLLTSPILWLAVAAVGVFVYFKKFHKGAGRKSVKFRR